jgi:hypothetical protein
MRGRRGVLVALVIGIAALGISPAKALLADGSYTIELAGALIDASPGTFDVIGGSVQNFTMDLLSDTEPANQFSTYSTSSTLATVAGGSMFEGNVMNDWWSSVGALDTISFENDGTWVCAVNVGLCSTSSFPLSEGEAGTYVISPKVSAVPLPGAVWLFLAALGSLRLFGWRKHRGRRRGLSIC